MNNSGPTRTMLFGGLGLALVAVIPLGALIANWLPSASESLFLLRSAPSQIIVDLALLASCVILAFGYRGETGIVGTSIVGRVGFLLVGLASVIQVLFSSLTIALNLAGTPAAIGIGTALAILPTAATAMAAVAVVRARVLVRFARWILLGVAVAEVVQFALSFVVVAVRSTSQDYAVAVVFSLAAVPLLLLLSAGVSFAVVGRTASIRYRVQSVHAAWRATT